MVTTVVRAMHTGAAFQRLGSILAWIVILSVYGAATIAEVKLLISPFCTDLLIYEINYWFYFAVFEEIYNNVGQQF
jgi:hypothetical protein